MPEHFFARRDILVAASLLFSGLRNANASNIPLHVLVVGDSQAQGLAGGLQRQYRRDPTVQVIDHSRIGTGLASWTRLDWVKEASEIPAPEAPCVAVVMFGANDRPPIRIHGQVNEPLRTTFSATYGGRVRAIATSLKKVTTAVIWVGHPIVRDPLYAEDMVLLNGLYADQSRAGGADWFPTWPMFVDAQGAFMPYGPGIDGQTTRLRADDGVHLTPAGYDVLARALQPAIARAEPETASQPDKPATHS